MNKKTNVLGVLCFGMSMVGFAQQQNNEIQSQSMLGGQLDEVVITDSRFELKRENSGKTIVKITAKELDQNSGRTISEIVNTKSGITINGSYGQAGSPLSTYVRGGQNRQVLVLIDGVAMSDPSQIENNFDLNLLSPSQIESIEILKGASSALYGNRASTAVINITLKKASKESISGRFSSFLATNNAQNDSNLDIHDFTNSVGVNGTLEKFSYQVNFSNKFTDGLSAIREETGAPKNESDVFSKYSGNIILGYNFSDRLDVSVFANLDNYRTQYDDSFFFMDENNVSKNKQYRFGMSPKFKYSNGSITLNVAVNNVEREFESAYPGRFDAKSIVMDIFNKYKFNDQLHTVLGVNYVKSEMNNIDDFTNINEKTAHDENIDPYANVTYVTNFGLNLNAGARLNNHSEYGGNFVYNVNPSYTFKINENKVKLMGSYSTAYITPSLYQLFVPGFGNADLKPQEDTTLETGFETAFLAGKLRFSAIYFNRKQSNFIDYVTLDFTTFEAEYQNITDEYKLNGIEMELNFKPSEALAFNANYTFTEKKNDFIVRVPKQKVNASVGYQLCHKTFIALDYQFTGKRVSSIFEPDFVNRRTLESYSLMNFNVNQKILKNKMQLFVGISNIFDEDYEEFYRFSTRGRNYRMGFILTL